MFRTSVTLLPKRRLQNRIGRRSTRYCQWHLDVAKTATNALAPPTQSELEVTACKLGLGNRPFSLISSIANHQLLVRRRRLAFNFRER
jgi:hypothetical protein